jgi:predicted alpha/beta superfamily hydrolase
LALPATSLAQATAEPKRVTSLTGIVRKHVNFHSNVLGNDRDLVVYLPPGYDEHSGRRYPVLYMHDGQNVFDGMTSYIPNQEWRADEAAQALIEANAIEPIIIVGINNAGMDRGNEYLPTRRQMGSDFVGGRADKYGDMIVNEIKPLIDRTYRTKPDRANTGLCGSSFGGIITLHLGITRPNVFGKLAVVSPSVWWDERVMLKRVAALPRKPNVKMWVDMGTDEGPGAVRDAADLRDALIRKGFQPGKDLLYYLDRGAKHNEAAWAGRFDAILLYLFGK